MLITTVMYHYVRDLENSLYPKIKALKKTEFINQLSILNQIIILLPSRIV